MAAATMRLWWSAVLQCDIFLAALALATDEPPVSVASAKTAGVAEACFQASR